MRIEHWGRCSDQFISLSEFTNLKSKSSYLLDRSFFNATRCPLSSCCFVNRIDLMLMQSKRPRRSECTPLRSGLDPLTELAQLRALPAYLSTG